MITFKEWLNEDIYLDGGKLVAVFDKSSGKRDYGDENKSSRIITNRAELSIQSSLTRGRHVRAPFLYITGDESTELLKKFKAMSNEERAEFIEDAASHIAKQITTSKKADIVLTPKSSSALTEQFAKSLAAKLGVKSVSVGVFEKTVAQLPEDPAELDAYLLKNYIDVAYIKEKVVGQASQEKMIGEVTKMLRSMLKSNNGQISSKGARKEIFKFVKNIMKLNSQLTTSLSGKRVIVVDDILSSGGTMTDMFRICDELGAARVDGITLFARTSKPAKK